MPAEFPSEDILCTIQFLPQRLPYAKFDEFSLVTSLDTIELTPDVTLCRHCHLDLILPASCHRRRPTFSCSAQTGVIAGAVSRTMAREIIGLLGGETELGV